MAQVLWLELLGSCVGGREDCYSDGKSGARDAAWTEAWACCVASSPLSVSGTVPVQLWPSVSVPTGDGVLVGFKYNGVASLQEHQRCRSVTDHADCRGLRTLALACGIHAKYSAMLPAPPLAAGD